MSYLQVISDKSEAGVVTSGTSGDLHAIGRPDCSAAIWKRRPLPGFQSWIDGLAPDRLPRARMILRPDRVADALTDLAEALDVPQGRERDILTDDASALAAIFADIMKTPYLRFRLDVITTNACRKFHIDAVTARLICTYRGNGTQYGISAAGQEPTHIHQVPTGSPMILRGTNWPVTPPTGLVHRSPPIEGTGETRLVLVLDPITDIENEMDPVMPH